MRGLIDRNRLILFMQTLGHAAGQPGRVYLTGGASAVLFDWRSSTIDVDLEFRPDSIDALKAIPAIKNDLSVNVELASPSHFIPELPGWEARSLFIQREGVLDFFHYDFYAQALSKIERGHAHDLVDIRAMHRLGLISASRLMELFSAIEPELYRYPALDPPTFRRAVETMAGQLEPSDRERSL